MSLGKGILQGMMGAYLMEGVNIDKIDWNNHTLYITVPRESYSYGIGKIQNAKDFAKRIKETWIEMGIFPKDCAVKYKIRDVYWTKEMGDKNYSNNKDKVLDMTLWI